MKKSFELKKTNAIFFTELKTKIKSFVIWAAAVIGMTLLYMLLFPQMKEIALAKFESMPQELLAVFGMENYQRMMNYNYYYAMIYQLFCVVFCGYAVAQGAGIFHNEETNGTIEYLYSNNVSRSEIFVAKAAVVLTRILILTLCSFITALICGAAVASDVASVKALVLGWAVSLAAMLFFASLGFLLGSAVKRNISASGIGLGILLATYFTGYLSELIEDFSFLKWFSPTHLLSPQDVMASSWGAGTAAYDPAGLILYLCLSVGITVAAFLLYRRKDLQ